MRLEKYIYLTIFSLVSFLLNIGLGIWLYFSYRVDPSINNEIQKSKGRIEVLREQVSRYSKESHELEIQKDSVMLLLSKKPKERIVIKTVYEQEVDRVISLPIDSSILYLTKRLSETDLNR